MKVRKNEYKPLLFTTTIRNPERIKEFIKYKDNLDIVPISIKDFIATAEINSHLEKLLLLKSCI